MKNSGIFGVVLFLIGSSAGATGQPLLTATQHSGYTTMEDAFEYHCELSTTGAVTGYFNSNWNGTGWNTQNPYSFQLAARAVRLLKRNIHSAKSGRITDGAAQCDAGSTEISAAAVGDSSAFTVVKALDCDQSHVNQSRAAQDLRVWVANMCKIKY